MKKISFSENQKNIMLNKIGFLENQLADVIKKKEKLEEINEGLRNAIADLSNDKTQIMSIINGERSPQVSLELKDKDIQIESLKTKLFESNTINEQYQKQLRRMEKNMSQHIQAIELAHERQKKYFLKRIECLQIALKKEQTAESQFEDLKCQNSNLKKKLSKRNESQINTSQLELESVIKALDKRDTTFTLEDIENISFNRMPTQSDFSNTKSRLTMTRSRSGISQRKIISSLYCELCQQNYSPNEYYKHFTQHGEKGKLILQKIEIQRKLKEKDQRRKLEDQLNTIVVALKDHEKRHCVSSRTLIR